MAVVLRSIERVVEAARGVMPPDKDQDPRTWRVNVFLSLLVIFFNRAPVAHTSQAKKRHQGTTDVRAAAAKTAALG